MDLEQEITTKEQLEKETKDKVESAKIALNEIFAGDNENNYPARHIVKKGETLWSISKKYGTSVLTLQKINGLKDGDILSEGKILYIR